MGIFLIFLSLYSNSSTLNFVAQIVLFWWLGTPLDWFLYLFDMSHPFLSFFLNTPVLQGTPGRSCVFLFPVLESPTSSRRLVPLIGVWCSEIKVQVQGILIARGCHCLRPFQQTELGDTCLYSCICFKMWTSEVLHIHIIMGSFLSTFTKREDLKTNFDHSLRIFIAYNLDEIISKWLQGEVPAVFSRKLFIYTFFFF